MERSASLIAVSLISEVNDKLQQLCPTWMIRPKNIVDILDYDVDIKSIKEHLRVLQSADDNDEDQVAPEPATRTQNNRRAASAPVMSERNGRSAPSERNSLPQRRGNISRTQNEREKAPVRTDRRRGRKRRIDPDVKAEVVQMYNEGWSVAEIAEKLGISVSSASRFKDGD